MLWRDDVVVTSEQVLPDGTDFTVVRNGSEIPARLAGRDPGTTRLADVMTPQPQTIHPDEPFLHAMRIMRQNCIVWARRTPFRRRSSRACNWARPYSSSPNRWLMIPSVRTRPERSSSTLAGSTSRPMTSKPSSAMQAAWVAPR